MPWQNHAGRRTLDKDQRMSEGDLLHVVATDNISPSRRFFGQVLIWGSALVLVLVAMAQVAQDAGWLDFGFANWRPTLYGYVFMPSACAGVRFWSRESRASASFSCCLRRCLSFR
jgi:hypothetical protein